APEQQVRPGPAVHRLPQAPAAHIQLPPKARTQRQQSKRGPGQGDAEDLEGMGQRFAPVAKMDVMTGWHLLNRFRMIADKQVLRRLAVDCRHELVPADLGDRESSPGKTKTRANRCTDQVPPAEEQP